MAREPAPGALTAAREQRTHGVDAKSASSRQRLLRRRQGCSRCVATASPAGLSVRVEAKRLLVVVAAVSGTYKNCDGGALVALSQRRRSRRSSPV